MIRFKQQTIKYFVKQGGELNMKLKHVLVSSLAGLALLTFQPNFVNAENEASLNNAEVQVETVEIENQTIEKDTVENDRLSDTYDENTEVPDEDIDKVENPTKGKIDKSDEEKNAEENIETEDQTEIQLEPDEQDQEDATEEVKEEEEELGSEKDKNSSETEEQDEDEKDEKTLSSATKSSDSDEINLSGDEIVQLKKDLTKLGFGNFPASPSNVYGRVTANVVKEFQKEYGLKADGVANQRTLEKIKNILKNALKNGDKGSKVRELKQNLTLLGFGNFPNNPSQIYGNVTANVVKEFQRHYNLRVSGIAELNTLDKIRKILEPPYQDGDRGLHITELKKDLSALGFGNFPTNPSLAYGKITANVVKEFQKEYGLKADGIANQRTLEKIKNILKNALKNGDKGSKVRELKQNLTLLGFGNFPNNPSQIYGNVTANVVKEFQKEYGLRISGIADEKTLGKLKDILKPPYQTGDKGRHIAVLKENLSALGFGNFPTNPSQNYGSITANVVRDFQKFFGLKQNGVVNAEALQIINDGLHNPIKGKSVVALKKHLTKLGFGNFPTKPSQTYGKVTSRVVKQFQRYYGVKVTGNAGQITLKTLKENVNSPYQRGNSSSNIAKIKKDLRNLGFGNFPNNPSQTYGAVTERVVKQFQRAYGLVENGIMDSVSLKKLKEESSTIKIFIDAGHGGSDSGASANGLKEKNLTLEIAKEVERLLRQYKNVEIKMSRSSDKTLSLKERTNMANDWGADFFLSVHINAGGGTGIESYVHNKNATRDAKNKQNIIHDHLINGLRSDNVRDRGKKEANFHVLRESKMSALLVEYLFIDHRTDANKLKSRSFKNKLARLTAEGLAKAFNLIK